MHKVLVNRLVGLSLPRKSVVRLTDRPDMTFNVYHGRKTSTQQQQPNLQSVIAEVTSHHLSNDAEADNTFARVALDESSIPDTLNIADGDPITD